MISQGMSKVHPNISLMYLKYLFDLLSVKYLRTEDGKEHVI